MRYLSCKYIEHGMDFEHTRLDTCCFTSHAGGGHIPIIEEYRGETLDWEEIFKFKRQLREQHKQGNLTPQCKGCIFLEEDNWDDEDYINYLQFNYWVKCNSNCRYCYVMKNPAIFDNLEAYNALPIIQDMVKRNILRPGGEVSFGGGEPTIHQEFDELIDLLTENHFRGMKIHSSGIKFSQAIAKSISAGSMKIVVSVDSGSKEIYEKIKRVPCFDKVMANLKKYAGYDKGRYGAVISKYIIIPDINDNYDEIEKWIQCSLKANLKALAIDLEDYWYKDNRECIHLYYLDLIDYVIRRTSELGLTIELYDRAKGLKQKHSKEGI